MQRFFLLNALASMVALAAAYPMSGEITGHCDRSQARECGPWQVSSTPKTQLLGFPSPLPTTAMTRSAPKARLLGFPSLLPTTAMTRSAASTIDSEDEAAGISFTTTYDGDDQKRGKYH
ncbi:uncharacterized protein EDB93DRAFT_1100412 [Suillus bovinus]|uniref:uncharacterized protein n=1 Tax=Suillus bovinus TaxID=48563 RepID=UPI001B886FEC|nr:uncharacterized protein EDB93DRAFT_1100412 [Suillus bovinus]KAG2158179.1 hypothetical protein EDB93DRAFT_1100412 [Suillus bovinus]